MYCRLDDLLTQIQRDVLLRVAGDDEGEFVPATIDNGISQAQAEIDAYCGGLYRVPFATVPAIIRKLAIDMSLFHIFSGYGFNFSTESADRIILVRYEKAIEFLKQIALGKIQLPGNASSTTDDQGIGTGNLRIKSEDRIFGRSNMGAF